MNSVSNVTAMKSSVVGKGMVADDSPRATRAITHSAGPRTRPSSACRNTPSAAVKAGSAAGPRTSTASSSLKVLGFQ